MIIHIYLISLKAHGIGKNMTSLFVDSHDSSHCLNLVSGLMISLFVLCPFVTRDIITVFVTRHIYSIFDGDENN